MKLTQQHISIHFTATFNVRFSTSYGICTKIKDGGQRPFCLRTNSIPLPYGLPYLLNIKKNTKISRILLEISSKNNMQYRALPFILRMLDILEYIGQIGYMEYIFAHMFTKLLRSLFLTHSVDSTFGLCDPILTIFLLLETRFERCGQMLSYFVPRAADNL